MAYLGKEPSAVPIDASDIPDNSITAAKIVDGVITIDDIGADAVGASELVASVNTDIATGVTANTTANAALPKAGGTMTGAITTLSITETEATSSATTYTVDLANGTLFEVTSATTCTVTMPTAAAGKSFTVISTVPAAWSGTIIWSGGAAPTTGSAKTIYSFISNGTNWYGMQAGTGFA
jgi:hypothetical protein